VSVILNIFIADALALLTSGPYADAYPAPNAANTIANIDKKTYSPVKLASVSINNIPK
jgi:hypothetical protein